MKVLSYSKTIKHSIVSMVTFIWIIGSALFFPGHGFSQEHILTIQGNQILADGNPVKLIGLRCSNALISDKTTEDLIANLDLYKSYGLNTVSVYFMGSRFGDVKGYLPNTTIAPAYRDRMERILKATREREMFLLVGCLYWGTSSAKEKLKSWTQQDAENAIANTATWLKEKGYKHIILDPDNEGMAVRQMNWNMEGLISAAKNAYPELLVGNNTRQNPTNEDLNLHFGEKETDKPYIDSESTPKTSLAKGYWHAFSKAEHLKDSLYYNYSRIGRYTKEMKKDQISKTREEMKKYNGILLASTWLQCGSAEGINGPFATPGGQSKMSSEQNLYGEWNTDVDKLHPDAGILWWLEFVRDNFKAKVERQK